MEEAPGKGEQRSFAAQHDDAKNAPERKPEQVNIGRRGGRGKPRLGRRRWVLSFCESGGKPRHFKMCSALIIFSLRERA
jgi:hypothetical protein